MIVPLVLPQQPVRSRLSMRSRPLNVAGTGVGYTLYGTTTGSLPYHRKIIYLDRTYNALLITGTKLANLL